MRLWRSLCRHRNYSERHTAPLPDGRWSLRVWVAGAATLSRQRVSTPAPILPIRKRFQHRRSPQESCEVCVSRKSAQSSLRRFLAARTAIAHLASALAFALPSNSLISSSSSPPPSASPSLMKRRISRFSSSFPNIVLDFIFFTLSYLQPYRVETRCQLCSDAARLSGKDEEEETIDSCGASFPAMRLEWMCDRSLKGRV